eukprot:gene13074-17524_t
MEIPRLLWNSSDAVELIRCGKPVVLTECPLCYPPSPIWSVEELSSIIDPKFKMDVFSSTGARFTYWDNSKNNNGYSFQPPTTKMSMTMPEFFEMVSGDNNNNTNNYYLQQGLVAEMGPRILEEYVKFSFDAAANYKNIGQWNELTNNLLLLGKKGFITPLHFDEQENLFVQLDGIKRVRLFSPNNWHRLYPYPVGHPCDRQSQITLPLIPGSNTFENPDDNHRFPAFSRSPSEEMYADLSPGEVLYIPQYWFHQMEGMTNNTSLSWWFKHNTKQGIDVTNINLKDISLIAVRRNLESILTQIVGSGRRAHNFFLSIASNRLTIPHPLIRNGDETTPEFDTFSFEELVDDMPFLPIDLEVGMAKLNAVTVENDSTVISSVEAWNEVVIKAVEFASLIVKPQFAVGFLKQLVSGRFNAF